MAPLALGRAEDEPRGEAETRLLAQDFLLAPGATVAQLLRPRGLAVLDFVRFRCGEEAGGKLGENMALRRAAWLAVPRDCHIAWYVHGSPPDAPPRHPTAPPPPPALGKYGALVACRTADGAPPSPAAAALCRQLAQHVVGMAPLALGRAEDEPRGEAETRLLAQDFLLAPGATVAQLLRPRGLAVLDFVRFRCGEEAGGGHEAGGAARG
ncbi:elongation factor Ts, mitochondrial [Oxyura jamaicensis]|uniref:elongation factor Ts, mitochondrial n=1 Tax=Oxyura jamaicensis TaxID=8884 RepID=UPI0015A558D9|nr:elongation factor Ts, mitochondrial [Oxyura jamaicensis]